MALWHWEMPKELYQYEGVWKSVIEQVHCFGPEIDNSANIISESGDDLSLIPMEIEVQDSSTYFDV